VFVEPVNIEQGWQPPKYTKNLIEEERLHKLLASTALRELSLLLLMFPLLLANSVLGFFRLFAKFCACEGQGCLNSFLNPRSSPVGHLEIAVENLVVDALAEKKVTAGTEIITQGDQADYFYVLDEGECDVFKACAFPPLPSHLSHPSIRQ